MNHSYRISRQPPYLTSCTLTVNLYLYISLPVLTLIFRAAPTLIFQSKVIMNSHHGFFRFALIDENRYPDL